MKTSCPEDQDCFPDSEFISCASSRTPEKLTLKHSRESMYILMLLVLQMFYIVLCTKTIVDIMI